MLHRHHVIALHNSRQKMLRCYCFFADNLNRHIVQVSFNIRNKKYRFADLFVLPFNIQLLYSTIFQLTTYTRIYPVRLHW